ncbi:hypothetical protein BLNAU_14909 [Blattamonas nauphoetae]|uniref:Uncharacterized protein n=1 Tax=Blattamonas nauphoetae TaxID=2049346 RepID=A0ABQ9XC69_9EUKA|nr:hypothetical protein BLNAU_14909 [Blattamonas nauphoetae]
METRRKDSREGHTLQSVMDELTRRGRDLREFLHTPSWQSVPGVIRSWKEGDDNALLVQLLGTVNDVLMEACDADIPIVIDRLLHSSLSSLAQNPSLPKNVLMRVTHCLTTLKSVGEGPFVMMEREELRMMERRAEELTEDIKKVSRQKEEQAKTIIEMRKKVEDLEEKGREEKEKQRREFEEMMNVQRDERGRQLKTLGEHAIAYYSTTINKQESTFSQSVDRRSSFLLSFEIGHAVARFSFVLGSKPDLDFFFGIVESIQSEAAFRSWFPALKGGAGWGMSLHLGKHMFQNGKHAHSGKVYLDLVPGQTIVLEADGREGRKTLKLSQDGQTQPAFFTNIPVPFRFAVSMYFGNETV